MPASPQFLAKALKVRAPRPIKHAPLRWTIDNELHGMHHARVNDTVWCRVGKRLGRTVVSSSERYAWYIEDMQKGILRTGYVQTKVIGKREAECAARELFPEIFAEWKFCETSLNP